MFHRRCFLPREKQFSGMKKQKCEIMKEYCIHNMEELIAIISSFPADKTIWYRGHGDISWPLIPSVQREEYLGKEQYLTNDFYMKASVTLREKPDFRSYSDWLTIMRHYGLPTRVLDWSRSPLIAAYFAVGESLPNEDADACIWVLHPEDLNVAEGFNHYLYSIDSNTAVQMIRPAFKKEYVPDNPKVLDHILACYPIEHDLRVYVQQSAFTLHNSLRRLEDIASETMLSRIVIPAEAKKVLAKELQALGITVSYVYPDSEHIAKEVTERYR